jgi:hypothetical protein
MPPGQHLHNSGCIELACRIDERRRDAAADPRRPHQRTRPSAFERESRPLTLARRRWKDHCTLRRAAPTSMPAKLVVGLVMAFMGLTCGSVGTGMVAYPDDAGQAEAGAFWLGFSIVALLIPSVILVVLGLRTRATGKRLERLAAMANAAARLPLDQVASDLGVTRDEARGLLFDAISQGRIAGRMDLEHGVFISGSAHTGVQQLSMHCRSCGATSTVIVSAGTTSLCQYCGFRLA